MKISLITLLFSLFSFALVGCSNTEPGIVTPINEPSTIEVPTTIEPAEPASDLGYPANVVNEPQEAYPAIPANESSDIAYPAPERIYDESKRFAFSKPVNVGATRVTGTGPINIPIQIISVSNIGETLGSGAIQDDGTFEILLSRELEPKEAIAIKLANDSTRSDFLDAPGATDIPMIGFILEMAITE